MPRVTTLSAEQIGVLCWANEKWRPEGKAAQIAWLDDCIAVALAESGGRIDAVSATKDYGLFQINQKAHSQLFSTLDWRIPNDNIEMARRVYAEAGNKWSPWTTYGGMRYMTYKGRGRAVWDKINAPATPENPEGGKGFVEKVLGNVLGIIAGTAAQVGIPVIQGGEAVKDAAGGITNVVQGALSDAFKWLGKAGLTVGAFLLVIVLLVLGLYLLVGKPTVASLMGGNIGAQVGK